jgi:ribosomal protein S20
VDYQVLFNVAFGLAGFFGGWVLNNLSKSIERLDTDVRAMPHNYVSKDDWREAMKEMKDEMRSGFDKIEKNLGTIFKKLDQKEDKG